MELFLSLAQQLQILNSGQGTAQGDSPIAEEGRNLTTGTVKSVDLANGAIIIGLNDAGPESDIYVPPPSQTIPLL